MQNLLSIAHLTLVAEVRSLLNRIGNRLVSHCAGLSHNHKHALVELASLIVRINHNLFLEQHLRGLSLGLGQGLGLLGLLLLLLLGRSRVQLILGLLVRLAIHDHRVHHDIVLLVVARPEVALLLVLVLVVHIVVLLLATV